MPSLRGFIIDNLGVKLVALLLAVLVYLYVYTGREARLTVAFPLHITGLAATLALAGPVPAAIEAELVGTGRQLLALKFLEPRVEISLAGVGPGRVVRPLATSIFPLPRDGRVRLERVLEPTQLVLRVEPRVERRLPVRLYIQGEPARGYMWNGRVLSEPESVTVSGPQSQVSAMRAVTLGVVPVNGARDTVVAMSWAQAIGPSFRVEPRRVRIKLPVEQVVTRRLLAPVRVRGGRGSAAWAAEPGTVTVEITALRGFWQRVEPAVPVGYVSVRDTARGGRAPVRLAGPWRDLGGVRVAPESVRVRRTVKSQGPIG